MNIPSNDVWMSKMELVELFGVIAPTLRAAIKAVYKSGILNPTTTQLCDLATSKSWATFYSLEVDIALTFRLNTYEADRIRQKVLIGVNRQKDCFVLCFRCVKMTKTRCLVDFSSQKKGKDERLLVPL